MKILSFNCRGLARPDKKLAFQRMIMAEPVNIVFLQETLGNTEAISRFLASMLPGWTFQALDASRRSRGLALGLNSRTIKIINSWGGPGHLGVDLLSAKLNTKIMLINVYAPCHQRAKLWAKLLSSELLREEPLILGGDLNFSIGHAESWGHHAQADHLSEFFEHILEVHNMVDHSLAKMNPTWRNNRVGEVSLSKRLDCFLIKESFLSSGFNLI